MASHLLGILLAVLLLVSADLANRLVAPVQAPAAFVDESRRVGDRFTILKGESPLSKRREPARGEPIGARVFGGIEP